MKIGSVIEYVTRYKKITAVEVIQVVSVQRNAKGETLTTMWVQTIRKTRRAKPMPFTVATFGVKRRVIGHGPVVTITS